MKIYSKIVFIISVAVISLQFCSAAKSSTFRHQLSRKTDSEPIISSDANSLTSMTKVRRILQRNKFNSKRAAPSPIPTNWTVRSQQFYKIVSDLGLFQVTGVTLEKVPEQMVDTLKSAKDNILVVPNSGNHTSKRQFHDFCVEKTVKNVVLASPGEKLAYKIKSVQCQGKCDSKYLGITLGKCVLSRKDFVVYVEDENNNFVPKVVKVGCACECLHYSRFQ